ncbi:MAG TPA: CBS domain-containing protein [Nitrospira sp.]|jgi:signal-transduction protein with cAMP-binding, CBS, and nucleotidyltransferase domain|nr:CBS domain-containing protein [Nitrospira sp.]
MTVTRTNAKKPRISLDRSIERMRKHLSELAPYLKKSKASGSLEEFDAESERLIAESLGETSSLLDAYQYAQLGEAAGLVNMTEEAPESVGLDSERQSLMQRSRVLESCVSELEARRAVEPKKLRQALTGPQVAEHMSADLRSVPHTATLREAGQLMQKWKTGSLLVTDKQTYVGFITDSALARDVVANGLDPNTTAVKTCVRTPLVSIHGDRPLIEAVRLMKEQATRHLAVAQDDQIIGVISVSNILRYYSGVV